ncbi:unnamed protein product [Periconia digitata]|uniref:Uncharacterized protein n=1 Tax=Periconia digitata TaxID=1303443 RepID=A0A9W4UFN6_9PLEO|nr:unnamed protein product [Periconia digitata]
MDTEDGQVFIKVRYFPSSFGGVLDSTEFTRHAACPYAISLPVYMCTSPTLKHQSPHLSCPCVSFS